MGLCERLNKSLDFAFATIWFCVILLKERPLLEQIFIFQVNFGQYRISIYFCTAGDQIMTHFEFSYKLIEIIKSIK